MFTKLSNEITGLLNMYLSDPWHNDPKIVPIGLDARFRTCEEKLWLGIELTLKQDKFRGLFFRDFSGNTTTGDRAVLYLSEVFLTRTEVANTIYDQPPPPHHLMVCYLRESLHENWQDCFIKRSQDGYENYADSFFKKVGDTLKEQCKKLGDKYSTHSKNLLAEHGSFWLNAGANKAKVAEELSLCDVFSVIAPIKQQQLLPMAPGEPELDANASAMLLKGILQNRNERYGLLVALGMNPEEWLIKQDDSENGGFVFSIQNLRQLKVLVQAVKKSSIKAVQNQTPWYEKACFKATFTQLKADKKKYASFKQADDCYQFYCDYINPKFISIDENDEDEDGVSQNRSAEGFTGLQTIDQLGDAELRDFPEEYPGYYNPVTAYVWKMIIVENAELFGKYGLKFMQDPKLQQLISDNPQLGYDKLSQAKRLEKLREELDDITKKLL